MFTDDAARHRASSELVYTVNRSEFLRLHVLILRSPYDGVLINLKVTITSGSFESSVSTMFRVLLYSI
jgi:hypothetical protein